MEGVGGRMGRKGGEEMQYGDGGKEEAGEGVWDGMENA